MEWWTNQESCSTCGWLLEGMRCEGIDCAGDGNGCYRSRFATRMHRVVVSSGIGLVGVLLGGSKRKMKNGISSSTKIPIIVCHKKSLVQALVFDHLIVA